MTTARQRAKSDVYQLKVILEDITPLIWRSIQVPGDITLYRLHRTLQAVMGWTESHLYMFDIGGAEYSDPSPEWGIPVMNAQRTRLADIVPGKGSAFIYEYDLGDGWTHELIVEDILPRDPDMRYPVCLAGERACPPEDCGGAGGYEEMLVALRDPRHQQHQEFHEWLGGPFDPEDFDVDDANRTLSAWGLRRR